MQRITYACSLEFQVSGELPPSVQVDCLQCAYDVMDSLYEDGG